MILQMEFEDNQQLFTQEQMITNIRQVSSARLARNKIDKQKAIKHFLLKVERAILDGAMILAKQTKVSYLDHEIRNYFSESEIMLFLSEQYPKFKITGSATGKIIVGFGEFLTNPEEQRL